jgi:hypothetical protein
MERVDRQGEGGRMLPPARVVQVVAGKRRAPVLKHSLEAALGERALSDRKNPRRSGHFAKRMQKADFPVAGPGTRLLTITGERVL